MIARNLGERVTCFNDVPDCLAEVEKLLIKQTLTHVASNREQAAKALGISRRALQYKLKEYGLLSPEKNRLPEPSAIAPEILTPKPQVDQDTSRSL